jgi:hypothetical protein
MPLTGDYEPSSSGWARENAELKGKAVILLTTIGAKTGKVRKTPLMRVEHNGEYEAREIFSDEKAAWWQRAVAAWPDYAEYQQKTDRQIPVFVLTPIL